MHDAVCSVCSELALKRLRQIDGEQLERELDEIGGSASINKASGVAGPTAVRPKLPWCFGVAVVSRCCIVLFACVMLSWHFHVAIAFLLSWPCSRRIVVFAMLS